MAEQTMTGAGRVGRQRIRWVALVALGVGASACSLISGDEEVMPVAEPVDGIVSVSFGEATAEISPLIRGVSGQIEEFEGAGITLNSWGGQRATRYNYQLGNAWNLGRQGAFRNEGIASTDDLVGDWLASNEAAGVVSRVAVPGLGWIARDDSAQSCSFPDTDSGGCLTVDSFDCESGGAIADPTRANVGSSPQTVAEWIDGYVSDRVDIDFLAVDNEPERWGVDHYDVHPTCSDYFEIFGTYVAYAAALREVAPDTSLAGPVMCCWFDYANPPGPDDESDQDLLSWFLEHVEERSAPGDRPLLDVVDVHFRPQADVVTSRTDADIDRLRIDATRELWDPEHEAEGGPTEPIEFLPRLRRTIDEVYPSMDLMVSDWRFGGESTTGGALAVVTTLGVFAQEGIHAAAHADTIDQGSPAYFGFKLFGDYDGRGGAFEGLALPTMVDEDLVSVQAFSALDGRTLRLLLVNSSAGPETQRIGLDLAGVEASSSSTMYTYSGDAPDEIVRSRVSVSAGQSVIDVAPMSAVIVELSLRDAPEPTVPEPTIPSSTNPDAEAG